MTRLVLSDSRTLALLDDLELEDRRLAFLTSVDERSEVVVVVLCVRAVPVIELVCRERGAARGLGHDRTLLAIEDAAARLLLRLHRVVPLPPVGAIAAQLAAACIDSQSVERANRHQLAAGRARLALLPDLDGPRRVG
jgi:hypothetical protein